MAVLKFAGRNRLIAAGLALCIAAGVALQWFGLGAELDRRLLDREFEFLREHFPQPVKNDVVIVGIDERAFKAFREPFALWHPYLGEYLRAMAAAKPAVVGLDIVLPEHSYHFLVPRYDQPLLQGLLELHGQSPVVLGQTLDDDAQLRPVFPPYVAVSGGDALASVLLCLDDDGVARRFAEALCADKVRTATLAGKMAARIGLHQEWGGLIDYSVGDAFNYVPFLQVLEWYRNGDREKLQQVFGGKPVLLGVVLPFSDRLRVPVALAAWEPLNHKVPGVLLHGQILRSMQNHGLIREIPQSLSILLAACAALFWLGRGGYLKSAVFVAFVGGMLAFAELQLWQSRYLPIGGILLAATQAFVARLAFDAVVQMRERRFLRGTFGHYVSPQILQEIMAGHIKPGLGGEHKRVCVLFADIRDFTALSENMPPEDVITLLDGYFTEMTAAIHKHGGTVDKFIGDGVMAFFGAPQALTSPEKNALEAAQEMLVRLRRYNRERQARNLVPLRIGIGLHIGDVVVGHVGSESRHEYTAIGDVVNTASKLEGLSKVLAYPVICSNEVAQAVGYTGGLADLGERPLQGHTAVRVYGWNPPLLADAESGT